MKTLNKDNEEFRKEMDVLKSSIDPRYLVESLGFKVCRDTHKELRGPCVIHGGDNTTAFRFNKETLTWICFTHKCHEIPDKNNDIIGLIMKTLSVDFTGAVNYLKQLTGAVGDIDYADYKRKKEKKSFIRTNITPKASDVIVTEESLSEFKWFRSDLFKNEGFSDGVLDYFEVGGGYTDKYGYVRDVIPIRGIDGKLLAYSLRSVKTTDYDKKYIITTNFYKDRVLYNLNNIKDTCSSKPIIVVEGFKSVWRLYEYGIYNVVAVMGSEITPGQTNLLMSYALNGVVILFDNDEAGVRGAVNGYNSLKNKLQVSVVFITETDEKGKGLDPSDLSIEQIYEYLGVFV